MNSVDERIVALEFNNKRFEDNVQTTLKSLDNLKKGLNLDGSAKSLANLGAAANNFSLGNIASNVEHIASKFTALGIIGITALQNIASQALNTGTQLVKSLTIDPIKGGYDDYGRKLTSIQTITNATGKSIEYVQERFNVLDDYADKTIYNLDDMTSSFAKFTNAGVDMDKSIPAIKGIANMVALAGQDANAAKIAMYNLSQSIAGGFLTTMDYKSLNLANVATKEWKDTLIQTAIASGTLKRNKKGLFKLDGIEDPLNDAQLFTEGLSSGWASTEVLLKVLGRYGDTNTEIGAKAQAAAQDVKSFSMMMETLKASVGTSWTDSFQLIIGDLNESKVLFTGLTNGISSFLGRMADARNEALSFWKSMGGRDLLIKSLGSAVDSLGRIIKPIKDAFREFFPAVGGLKLLSWTLSFQKLTEKLKIGDETLDKIKRTFRGVFAALDIGKQFLTTIAKAFGRLFTALKPAGSGLLDFSASVGDWLVKLNKTIKTSDVFATSMEKVIDFIKKVISKIKEIKTAIETSEFLTNTLNKIKDLLAVVTPPIKESITKIIEAFKSFDGSKLAGLQEFSDKARANLEPISTFLDKIKGAMLKVWGVIKQVGAFIGTALKSVFDGIKKMFSDENGDIDGNKLMAVLKSGLLTTIVVGLTKFMLAFSKLTEGGASVLKSIKGILDGVKGSLEEYQKSLKANTLLKIAGAIAILAASLLIISLIDPTKLLGAIGAITGLFAGLMGSMALMGAIGGMKGIDGVNKVALSMIGLSLSLLIMAAALKSLSELTWDKIWPGLIGLAGAAVVMIGIAKVMDKNSKSIMKTAMSFVTFAFGVSSLAKGLMKLAEVVKVLGGLEEDKLKQGLTAIAKLLAQLLIFSKISKMEKMGVKQGLGMIAFAVGLQLLANVVKVFGEMDPKTLGIGLGALTAIIVGLTAFLAITNGGKGLFETSVAMLVLSGALLVLSLSLKALGSLSLEELGKAALALVGVFLIFGAAGAILGPMSPLLYLVAGAILVLSLALLPLAAALKALGSLSLKEIGKALLTLVGVFAVLGIAALVLGPLTPLLFLLAGAIFLLGLGAMSAGLGLMLFAAGLSALAVSGVVGATALVAAVTIILSLIPIVMTEIGLGLIAFAGVIATSGPAILAAMTTVLLSLILAINIVGPVIILTLINLLLCLWTAIADAVPKFVDAGIRIMLAFLRGIALRMIALVEVGIDLILNFIHGIILKLPEIVNTAFEVVITFINGLADAIRQNDDAIFDAVKNLITAIAEAFLGFAGRAIDIGKNVIDGIITGIKEMAGKVKDAAIGVVKSLVAGVEKFLGINSPSKVFTEIGMYSDKGLAGGLTKYSGLVGSAATDVGATAVNSLSKAISKISDGMDADINVNPTIRPVLDLTNVQSGAKQINGLLASNQGIKMEGIVSTADAIAQSTNAHSKAQPYNEVRDALVDLKDIFKDSFDALETPTPQINFNGTYSFSGKEDIDYFMNQAALLVQRRKG